jgi:hypothetical protein
MQAGLLRNLIKTKPDEWLPILIGGHFFDDNRAYTESLSFDSHKNLSLRAKRGNPESQAPAVWIASLRSQ